MRKKKKLLLKIDEAIVNASIKKAEGIIEALKKRVAEESGMNEPIWKSPGWDDAMKELARDLWDRFAFRLFLLNYMDGNDNYVVDMNTDCLPFNVTGFEELCMQNWQHWLEGMI